MNNFMQRRAKLIGGKQERDEQLVEESRNQRNQTIILFAIVCIFVICHILRIILSIEDFVIHNTTFSNLNNKCKYGHPYWVFISIPISEILLKLNSSVNFFIYCAFNKAFRNVIHQHFLVMFTSCGSERCLRSRSRPTSTRINETKLTTLRPTLSTTPPRLIED